MSAPAPYLKSAAARRPVASISIDLDPLACYCRIHGLPEPGPAGGAAADVVLRRGLPRFLDLFARHGVQATFFVVGQDLEREAGRELLGRAVREGHELGNHSYSHPYDLCRRPRAEIREEVARCHEALRRLVPDRLPRGFRSPGYDMSPELWDVLEELGYRYDSSLFPSPPYYLLKALAMAGKALVGRRSRAVLADPRYLAAPAEPYRPDPRRPYRRGQGGPVELPVATTPWLRLPAIGTTLVVSEKLRTAVLDQMRRRPFFNLELHGLDLIDAREDGLPAQLVDRQPDLRVPLRDKERALCATLERLQAEYEIVPLHRVAEEVQRVGGLKR